MGESTLLSVSVKVRKLARRDATRAMAYVELRAVRPLGGCHTGLLRRSHPFRAGA